MSEQELTLGEHCVLSQVLFAVLLDVELILIQGAVVELTQTDNGQYTATQKQLAQGTPPSQVEGRKSVDWGLGPVKVRFRLSSPITP